VLVYPAYLMKGDHLAPEIRVDAQTPPMFLTDTADDPVNPDNCIVLFRALPQAKVAAELHLYAAGGHGCGLRPSANPCCTWPQRCAEWMKSRGILDVPR
jgi:hypothetical protein